MYEKYSGKYMNSKIKWLIAILSVVGVAYALLLQLGSWLENMPPDEGRLNHCLSAICEGDRVPYVDRTRFFQMKVDGIFLAAPNDIFMDGWKGSVFPIPGVIQEPNAPKVNAELFLEPDQNRPFFSREDFLIKAENNGWIASRTIVRPGLEVVRMRHLLYEGNPIDEGLYYVPLERLSSGQAPPWATWLSGGGGGGGAIYPWKYGIRVRIRWPQAYCDRWPEIYAEATRRMNLLEKVE
jgi:hypothetical protein